MAYDPGAIDATLAAALGEDALLIAELRVAFVDSATRAVAALRAAHDDAAWREAALRLKGLAASFGAVRLMEIAGNAAESPAHAPQLVERIERAVARL
jgi:HPt (histidine-containing phosphotransfer) domain-containing protein